MKLSFILVCLLTCSIAFSQTPEENLAKLNITLPKTSAPVANYVNAVRTGKLIYLAGKGPIKENGQYMTGKLGDSLTVEQGYEAARITGIIQIGVLKDFLGDLSKVKRIVKVNGYVNSTNNFVDQPKVMNGYSDLMVQVFGEKGKHARTSVSVNTLPFNIPVEVEMIVEVK